jgi:anionic cell wall polymer biosynthesis LytR-Cps2A-Psr (LCP) family protein
MKKSILGLILFGIFVLGFTITYLVLTFSKVFVKKPTATPSATSTSYSDSTPAPITNPKGVFNLVFLGYGGAGHSGSLLTDSIIIVHVDSNTGSAALISVPRDLWVPGNRKLNAEASVNGFQNVGNTLLNVTGLPINYFVSVDFSGFSRIVDNLGSVTIDNPKAYDDAFYPIKGQENNTCGFSEEQITSFKAQFTGFDLEKQFTCRYERLHFDKGSVNLNGEGALKFVRSRHGDSDFGRSLRQFVVLIGIENKLISLKSAGKLDSMINTLSNIVRTDLTAGTIKTLLNVFGDPGKYKISQIQLTTDNVLKEGKSSDGQYILTPKAGNFNFSEIKNFISQNIGR